MGLSREICRLCFHANPVGFSVPDNVWEAAMPPDHRQSVLCLACFARLADEKLIPWDGEIALYPVSMATHLGKVNEILTDQTYCTLSSSSATVQT
jgi:hypothetical protein